VNDKRPIKAISLIGVKPNLDIGPLPWTEWVRPEQLYVNESYQRNLSERSITLIRKIISGWEFARSKPPIVAPMGEDAKGQRIFDVIDGQHTAIAAASHPQVGFILVQVNPITERAKMAAAFVGHNRDRLGVTATQMHYAAIAAGDEDALTIEQVCARAGIKVLRTQPGAGYFKPRTTMAVRVIKLLCDRRGAMGARRVLQILADAGCAPILASQIRAVEILLFEPPYRGTLNEEDLTSVIMNIGPQAEQDVKEYAVQHKIAIYQAFAQYWARRAPLRRFQAPSGLAKTHLTSSRTA
jgi:hypothetical protein